jgi:hypothetical protein
MFEKFSRSWALIKASAGVLKQDKELLVFPAVSAIATLIVAASFITPLVGFDLVNFEAAEQGDTTQRAILGVWGFLFYFTQYFVIFFFNTALIGAAMIRLEGGDPTVADGFRIATSKIVPILGYAAIAATVGMILRAIEERAGVIGRWVAGLIGVAWTVVTFMTVPILVTRDVGPIDAIKESASMLKRTWGENVIGQGGVGIVFGLLQVLIIFATIGLAVMVGGMRNWTAIGAIVGLGVIAMVLVGLVQSALSGIYSAALYRYATGQDVGGGFDPGLLQAAFAPKKK